MKNCFLFLFLASGCLLLFATNLLPFPQKWLGGAQVSSPRILDRNGIVLREPLLPQGGRRNPIDLKNISPLLQEMTLFVEDRRFYAHVGVDPLAIFRAGLQNLWAGRVVAGGSTLTQQLARLLFPGSRTLPQKIKETALAFWLEGSFSKNQILALYLNNAPYGNELFGVAAASQRYFRKPSADLSRAEAAFLVGLVKAPTNLNPYQFFVRARARQELILNNYIKNNNITINEKKRLLDEKIIIQPRQERFLAPHFVDFVVNGYDSQNLFPPPLGGRVRERGSGLITTTLDYALQKDIELLLKNELESLADRGVTNAAVLVAHTPTGEILAYVGSRDYWDDAIQGMNDGVMSYRQPGSALKPFTYAVALERGLTAGSLLPDIPSQFDTEEGSYTPQNYDRVFHGPVLLRTALASSLNVPAVHALQKVGVVHLYNRLKKLGFKNLTEAPTHYGLGLTLGNAEVTLYEMVQAYSVFGRGGEWIPLRYLVEQNLSLKGNSNNSNFVIPAPQLVIPAKAGIQSFQSSLDSRLRGNDGSGRGGEIMSGTGERDKIFSADTSFLIKDILSDPQARALAFGESGPLNFPYQVLVKTGTSQEFRDNWTLGVTPDYTVGVWVGNFNGDPMHNVSGVTGAAPLFHRIVKRLYGRGEPHWPEAPVDIKKMAICPLSGKPVGPHCEGHALEYFVAGTEPRETCDFHGRVGGKRFVKLPEEYRAWAEGMNLPLLAREDDVLNSFPPPLGGRVRERGKEDKLAILKPRNGDVYKMDPLIPDDYETITFRVAGITSGEPVAWSLNGQGLGNEAQPHWQLQKGEHHVRVVNGGASDEVRFWVK